VRKAKAYLRIALERENIEPRKRKKDRKMPDQA
jgi:hypothetical protein